jgi:radical SAM protein with 4Fe4S-binding SPASM domain
VGERVTTPSYAVRVCHDYLVYSPLRGVAALVNRPALEELRDGGDGPSSGGAMASLREALWRPAGPAPAPRVGPVREPLFLGLVPTRGCSMACGYCTFLDAPSAPPMTLDVARAAVDAYLELIERAGATRAEIHFFGGEPLHAPDVVAFAVGHARRTAAERGLALHLEISTNGLCSAARAAWLGDHLDAVVLSLDGPAEVHDRNRPVAGGGGSFDVVFRTAKILSDSSADLVIRSCVTEASVERLEEWAETIGRELRPSAVCFERLTPSARSEAAGLRPPDPWAFARAFVHAARRLRDRGIEVVTSTTDLGAMRLSCCPVGEDALIVSPDGRVNACYLLEEQWRDRGLDLRLGELDAASGTLRFDRLQVARVRALAAAHAPRCEGCLCRPHCAGGCHVDHRPSSIDDGYDDLCISTRLITIAELLERVGRPELAAEWLEDRAALAQSALQPSDLLEEVRT